MNRARVLIALIALIFTTTACGDAGMYSSNADEKSRGTGGPGDGTGEYSDGESSSQGSGQAEAGVLTAADWDDNLNYDVYASYVDGFAEAHPTEPLPGLPTDRIMIQVVDGAGLPLRNAEVAVGEAGGEPAASLRTGSDGKTYFFPSIDGAAADYTVSATHSGSTTSIDVTADVSVWSITLTNSVAAGATALDLAFVIDTTGSMSDEIRYLQTELAWVIEQIRANGESLDVRMGLIAYRDLTDTYVVRSSDFTADLAQFQRDLATLVADGGGDYPEAMAEALDAAMDLAWRDDDAVRLTFLIADAPPQADRQVSTVDAALQARENGIRVYPVASSGVADTAEWVMRQLAQFTGGRYVFLTDDSGVGGSHAEPHIPCYYVQKLNALLLRLVMGEVSGVRQYPSSDDVIRTAGDPEDGRCVLQDATYYL